jgi:membrane-associated protein
MDIVLTLVDFVLHVDKHLELFVQNYGTWVYALLFLIIFVETGVVVMPFLPGDSLLFVVGAMCGVGLMSYPLSVGLLAGGGYSGQPVQLHHWALFWPQGVWLGELALVQQKSL